MGFWALAHDVTNWAYEKLSKIIRKVMGGFANDGLYEAKLNVFKNTLKSLDVPLVFRNINEQSLVGNLSLPLPGIYKFPDGRPVYEPLCNPLNMTMVFDNDSYPICGPKADPTDHLHYFIAAQLPPIGIYKDMLDQVVFIPSCRPDQQIKTALGVANCSIVEKEEQQLLVPYVTLGGWDGSGQNSVISARSESMIARRSEFPHMGRDASHHFTGLWPVLLTIFAFVAFLAFVLTRNERARRNRRRQITDIFDAETDRDAEGAWYFP